MRVDQSRAVSELVAGLKELAIIKKFRDVTLQNAVVNAMYAATIESEMPPEAVYAQLGGGNVGDTTVSYAETLLTAISQYQNASQHMKIDGVKIPHLFPGTKLHLHPVGTPGGVGQQFEASLIRYLAASLGLSYEELSRDYTKTNYSSARAAMANTWRSMQSRKKLVADGTANFIYRLWMEEAVNNNKLSTFPASKTGMLYTDGRLNMMFDALTAADWIGAARGQIDELKETQAAVLRIKWGLSTHEDELSRLGKDWRKVFAQKEREQKEMDRRGITMVEDNSVNAASGSPRDQTGDTEEESADDSETEKKKQDAE
jgi:lambda family phage portal protein